MPPPKKGKAKPKISRTPPTPTSNIDEPPIPFKRASSTLEPFLSKLPKNHVYITHLDTHPWKFKRQIFVVPLLMNIAIVGLLLWRVKLIGPYYIKIFQSVSGMQTNEINIDTKNTPTPDLFKELYSRSSTFILDLLLYVFVWPWPRTFFFGLPSNPIRWRLSVRFQDTEIIIRRSRKWDQQIGDVVREGGEAEEGGRLFLQNVRMAVLPSWMAKTGYIMLNKEWDLDWSAMIHAHSLVNKKIIPQDEFKTTIYVHSPEYGWVTFDAFPKKDSEANEREEEGRKKIMAFKDELTAMGKENLFFRWIEMIQFESSHPDGFGPERQAQAMAKAKELFESQGVDFEAFWEKVGGMKNMPGFDES